MELASDDIDLIMAMARELTGTKVDRERHSVIVQNVKTRMQSVGVNSLEGYLRFIDGHESEMSFFLSALTIHTTGWFRESGAFEKLETGLAGKIRFTNGGVFRVLSVACSTGEEVYSLALVLEQYRILHPGFEYTIEGWDIDPISVRTARNGNYDATDTITIPLRYEGTFNAQYRCSPSKIEIPDHIKDRCKFRSVNIVQPPVEADKYDYIMCRNMLIYFEEPDVKKIVSYILGRLQPHGWFCTGVSETSALGGSSFSSVGNATYAMTVAPKIVPPSQGSRSPIAVTASGLESKTTSAALSILVVEDEADFREMMCEYLGEKGYAVLAAPNAAVASELIAAKGKEIGLVLCDQRMPPGKTGLELCREVRAAGFKSPFVIVSGSADRQMALDAAQLGCNDVVLKPLMGNDLLRLVKSYIKTVVPSESFSTPSLILFGASTGGTEVLAKMLATLPPNCPPVVIVQHIAVDFATDFAQRLARVSGLKLGSMVADEILTNGHLYIALGDYHIGVAQSGTTLRLLVGNEPPISSHRPSVDFLFSSAANTKQTIFAALLTGMGRDGAEGLLKLKNQGAITYAQSAETCVVYGMPKEAVKLKAALHVGSPNEIRAQLDLRLSKIITKKAG